jgi:hypothetical protein
MEPLPHAAEADNKSRVGGGTSHSRGHILEHQSREFF